MWLVKDLILFFYISELLKIKTRKGTYIAENRFHETWKESANVLIFLLAHWVEGSLVSLKYRRFPPSILFEHLLLRNHWANEIIFRASIGQGNETLFEWYWTRDQDGRYVKNVLKSCLEPNGRCHCNLVDRIGPQVLPSLFKYWPLVDLWPFNGNIKFSTWYIYIRTCLFFLYFS